MKRALSIALILALTLMLFTGCTAAKKDEFIKIGYIGPLTGDGAPWGTTQVNTLNMLIEETNKNGGILGKQVKLFPYDNRGDNVESANVARKLIDQDGVCAIIGTNASGTTMAAAAVCEEKKIPQIATNATNVKVTLKDGTTLRPYTFRVCFTDPQLGGIIATYAYKTMGIKNAALLSELGSDYSTGVKDAFKTTFTALGGKVVADETYKTGEVDFRAQLSKIKESNPEAIFLPANYKQIGLAANQTRDLGIQAKFLGTDTWFTKDMLTLAAAAVEGATFTTMIDVTNEKLVPLQTRYKEKYGSAIDEMGTIGYFVNDAYAVLTAAIKKAGKVDSVAIRDAIEQTKDVDGCIGKITLKAADHNPTRAAAVMTIENGKFKTLSNVVPD